VRTTIEIIEAVKDGERPEYDELRYALLVIDSLDTMLNNFVLMDLYGKDKLDKFGKMKYENQCESRKKILNNDAKKAIGSFDPDLPGRQGERALHKKIGEKFLGALRAKEVSE
jgi:hypothetical protein